MPTTGIPEEPIYGNKGFIGHDCPEEIANSTGNRIWTIHRENQQHQHSSQLKRLISKVRQRIERGSHKALWLKVASQRWRISAVRRKAQGQVSLEGVFPENIKLLFQPPYAPELNLWFRLKKSCSNNSAS